MRIWTLHPKYLDPQGLVALWREALLVKKVLEGGTIGYRNHPQLVRFRATSDPEAAIATYMAAILDEATRRGYAFDASKVGAGRLTIVLDETQGQLLYEWSHLHQKLQQRAPEWRQNNCAKVTEPVPHPLFRIVAGGIQAWERLR